MQATFLFVYGTLKSENKRSPFLTRNATQFLGPAITEHEYLLDVDGAYPCMTKVPDNWPETASPPQHIKGELYEISPRLLEVTDTIEGVPYLFDREQIEVKLDGTSELHTAWAYFYQQSPDPLGKYANEWTFDGFMQRYPQLLN